MLNPTDPMYAWQQAQMRQQELADQAEAKRLAAQRTAMTPSAPGAAPAGPTAQGTSTGAIMLDTSNPHPQDAGNGFVYNPATQRYENNSTGQRYDEQQYQGWLNQMVQADVAAKKEKERVQSMAAQGLNADGSPIRKAFDTLVDPTTGKLGSNYQMTLNPLDPMSGAGYQKYQGEALRTGPSAWANLQNQQQEQQALQAKEDASRQAMGAMNQGNQALAMRGGLSTGARGLASRNSIRDLLMARQGAQRNLINNKLGVATTDEQNRIGQLANLTGMENQTGQFNKTLEGKQQEYNINNLLTEQKAKREYNDLTYTEQMKKWAAGKTADATRSSGGGGK